MKRSRSELDAILAAAEGAARAGAAIAVKMYRRAAVSHKKLNNLVTEADIAAEKAIAAYIKTRYPDHAFYGEEGETRGDLNAAHLWIVDPIDGTTNYAQGLPHFAVSVAYARSGTVVAGVVLDPMRNELFSAIAGRGARLNGEPVAVTAAKKVQDSLISFGFYYHNRTIVKRTLAALGRLLALHVRELRRMGSAALDLCWVSCGRLDGYFEYDLSPWDFAAGMLILTEAGGSITDRYGSMMTLGGRGVIASNTAVQRSLVKVVGWKKTNGINNDRKK